MLNPEWRGRIENWSDRLQKLCYQPLADVELRVHFPERDLTPAEAARQHFDAAPPGLEWGACWQYAWFAGTVKTPKAAVGHRFVIRPEVGGENTLYVDGRAIAGRDPYNHMILTLSRKAKAGDSFNLLIEAYAGHGDRASYGAKLQNVPLWPECPATQQVVKATTVGIWREECYQAWMDVNVLLNLRDQLDPDALRVAEIDQALMDFTVALDLEAPVDAMERSCASARKVLAPALAAKNGSTAPMMHCFGHSHIDIAWLWPLRETRAKCIRTFSTMLGLMEEYPEFKFLQSQPELFQYVKEDRPELYERIKAAAKRGQWLSEGAMYVESDTNVVGGESLVRQFIHGKRFFQEEFGVDCRLLWLPDVFGYSGALPQIMRGCGVDYFSTQKIYWNYNGGDPFPYTTFWWEGIDGTRVFSHFHYDYNALTAPANLITRWKERPQKMGFSDRLFPFGFGDGGGGPTRDHIENLRRMKDLEGAPRTKIVDPVDFFKEQINAKDAAALPTYVGELYFQVHRGTYTTQAKTKNYNRRCEFALREAEMWSTFALLAGDYAYPLATLDKFWKNVLLNQFHDIIPGSSINRVYVEAEKLYAETLAGVRAETVSAVNRLAQLASEEAETADAGCEGHDHDHGDGCDCGCEAEVDDGMPAPSAAFRAESGAVLTVFNSLSWLRPAVIALPDGWAGALDDGDAPLAVQRDVDGKHYTRVDLPPCGWTTVREATVEAGKLAAAAAKKRSDLKATSQGLENRFLRVRVNRRGEVTSILDKQTGRDWLSGPANVLRLYRDVPHAHDAWDLNKTYESCPVDMEPYGKKATVTLEAAGPVFAVLRVNWKLERSSLTQRIRLDSGSRTLKFETVVDWREQHKVLKVDFPLNVFAHEALHEIQFGHLARPTHRSRPFDEDRYEVCCHKWSALVETARGAAVLNDSKYGVSALGRTLSPTLLRSTINPDHLADQGEQRFTYAFHCWNGPFAESDLVQAGYELNAETPPTAPVDGGSASMLWLDDIDVIVETVKTAEDGSGDLIVRMYESKRSARDTVLRLAFSVEAAWEADMLENPGEKLKFSGDGMIPLSFRPFEIKTVRVKV